MHGVLEEERRVDEDVVAVAEEETLLSEVAGSEGEGVGQLGLEGRYGGVAGVTDDVESQEVGVILEPEVEQGEGGVYCIGVTDSESVVVEQVEKGQGRREGGVDDTEGVDIDSGVRVHFQEGQRQVHVE